MNCLYVVRYGDKTKIGITYELTGRYYAYAAQARRDGVVFEPLFTLPMHVEAAENEKAILDRFRAPGQRSEYLDVPADEVIAFVRTLPCTAPALPESGQDSEQWLSRAEVAKVLDVTAQTIDRYSRSGALPRRANPITKRVTYRIEDVRALHALMWSHAS